MSRIEASKIVAYGVTGTTPDAAQATKVVAYLVLYPGNDGSAPDPGQVQVCSNITRRLRR